jgi:GTP-binding protein HflX
LQRRKKFITALPTTPHPQIPEDYEIPTVTFKKPKNPRPTVFPTALPREKALIVGVGQYGDTFDVQDSLDELEQLCETAEIDVIGRTHQNINVQHRSFLIGKGKVVEIRNMLKELGADVVIFDVELSPTHSRELEEVLGGKVIDRTALILDIFARRARTHEGRLQVELAQLEYRLPRLTRLWTHLSRQTASGGGMGVGLRGPGETQLEIDRRESKGRIAHLKNELKHVKTHRNLYRQRRKEQGIPVVALVGYTNAGKSTLLNKLSDAGVLAEDKLFATLDPTTRRLRLPNGRTVLLTDTVGFIQRLPTTLVEAFRSTLEEVTQADLLVHVLDFTHPNAQEQSATVEQVLKELDADEKPTVFALNKIDMLVEKGTDLQDESAATLSQQIIEDYELPENYVPISAAKGIGLEVLLKRIEEMLENKLVPMKLHIPYAANKLVALFHEKGQVKEERYQEDGTFIDGHIPAQYEPLFRQYNIAS